MTSHNAADIRGLIDILEGRSTTILSEGPFDGVKAAFGDRQAAGRLQREDLANRMKQEWNVWLGQTGRVGNIEDMVQFLHVRVGLEPDDIRAIMGHERVGNAPNPDIATKYEPEPEQEKPAPKAQEPKAAEPEAEPEAPKSAYQSLTPDQKAELEAKGRLELPNGKVLWVGKPGDGFPETLRMVKDEDVQGAADALQNMSDEDFDKLVDSSITSDISDEEWAPIEAELERRKAKLSKQGDTEGAEDLQDIIQQLEKMVAAERVGESIIFEKRGGGLTKQQAAMVFDDAAKYVFANGILDREAEKAGSGGRGSRGQASGAEAGLSGKTQSQIHAFLRQHDITDETIFSLRETSRRARGLGSFKGSQDHKILALIGLAYLKYRD